MRCSTDHDFWLRAGDEPIESQRRPTEPDDDRIPVARAFRTTEELIALYGSPATPSKPLFPDLLA